MTMGPIGRHRLSRSLLATLLVALVLAAITTFQLQRPSLRLADGREVSVRAVTYGTEHSFVNGPVWIRFIWRFLPSATIEWRGFFRIKRITPEPSCMVWTSWRLPRSNDAVRFVSVVDRNGIESEPVFAQVAQPIAKSPDVILAWQLENYPRTESRIHLRFYERDGDYRPIRVGELTLRNPAGRIPRWHAHAPPVSMSLQGTEFTLTKLQCGAVFPKLSQPRLGFGSNTIWTSVEFQTREMERADSTWTVRRLELTSAGGNRVDVFAPRFLAWSNASVNVLFPAVLWPDDPDWRVRAELSRVTNFDPKQLVAVRGLPVWPSPARSSTNLQLQIGGVMVQTVAAIRQVTHLRPYVRGAYHPNSEVTLTFAPSLPGVCISLDRVVDNHGRPVRFGDQDDSMGGRYEAALELPADAEQLDLSFAVHRSQVVEFLARAEWVASTNAAVAPAGERNHTGSR